MSSIESVSLPPELIASDHDKLLTKVSHFSELGVAGLHAVFDFDRTLTTKYPGTDDEVTSWQILSESLPDEAKNAYKAYFEKYRKLEIACTLESRDAVEWWSSILNLFVDNKIDFKEVEQTFLERANIRPGTAELFDLFNKSSIPSTILSAGVRNIIELWCKSFKISPTLVISTELETDDTRHVVSWDKSTLVHVLNKDTVDHPELSAIQQARPNTLVVGDGFDDASMAPGDDNVIRVRFLDRRADDPATEAEMQRTFTRFDALITNGSMEPVKQLVDYIIKKSAQI